MKSPVLTLLALAFSLGLYAQNASLRGQLQDDQEAAVSFANIALYNAADSNLVKVETSDDAGVFQMKKLPAGTYFMVASFVGYADLRKENLQLTDGQELDLGVIAFKSAAIELEEATVTASRVMVETKPDRTVFNVEGTVNSVGSDAITLLRKAPGVTVDNNENINVLGRTGVLLYVDGKRLPLTGDDLSDYLKNLPAEQIDRIEIITNPGAKYEAEGNAGIIDIRLKKDKNMGANGSLNSSNSYGRYGRFNLTGSGNYRNKNLNVFGTLGGGTGKGYHTTNFNGFQNGFNLKEVNEVVYDFKSFNYRLGMDYTLTPKQTLGILIGGRKGMGDIDTDNRVDIANQSTLDQVDSTLIAISTAERDRSQQTYNINYRFDNKKGKSLNVDLDYGRYDNNANRFQPNRYFDPSGNLLTEYINHFDTPTDIDIYTFKVDYEQNLHKGRLSAGTKLSRVSSDNTFLYFDEIDGEVVRNNRRSNIFDYTENVYAAYLNYAQPLGKKFNLSAGLRAEKTDAEGNLQAFSSDLEEPTVVLDYIDWFPSAGLTWQVNPKNMLALNYGRRINRPDYNVLNPFNNQLSQLSYEKGNPALRPEIVNNIELGYTYAYRYNFKIGYSKTNDQITRLIGPDEEDPRASFISWENLAEKTVLSANFSAPFSVNKWWDAYMNLSASHVHNEADYGDGATVDLKAFSYSIYQQHTLKLPKGWKAEVSGYFSGPGIWGGVFKYDTSYSLNVGVQRKFLQDNLNVRLAVNDIFYQTGWSGYSEFNGLYSEGNGNWDSRRVSLSLSYRFGNQNVKSRKRKTGMEAEGSRVGGDQN